ncbi:MAG TPA: hypothetical protein VGO64_08055 [Candidatus Limnocylindrales bacterium]|jgi:hypothetical protein|nr:hypothetical protein [Candidatus Limnocylindrales bacterium]
MAVIVSLERPILAVDPGGEASVSVTLRNTGTVVDEFAIEVLGETAPWATIEPATLPLFPAAEGSARITFRPPRASSTRAGQIGFGVMVRSREDPDGSAVEEGELDVGGFLGPSAELIPRTSHGSRRARHDLAVDNRGNVRIETALEGLDPDRLVRISFDPPSLNVEPGVAGFARVDIRPVRTFWRGPARTLPFQVAVRPEAESTTPLLVDGSFLQESILPPWFMRALIALAALIVAAILLWALVLQPQIRSTAAQTLEDFGFSPKPGSAAAGGGGSGANPSASSALNVTPPPAGGQSKVDGRLDTTRNAVSPTSGTLSITDLVFSNPTGASGDLSLQRTSPAGTTQLLVLRLENFRDLDFHFVTPISIRAGETLSLVATCAPPTGTATPPSCTPAVFYSGFVQEE